MLATQVEIEALADRIEKAYRLRRPHWHGGCSSPRVWSAAAAALRAVHEVDPEVPPDAELFVASQPDRSPYPDPWAELTGAESTRRYRRRVRALVRALREELEAEVRQAEGRVAAGEAVGKVLGGGFRRYSPLGKFIVALRAGRPALARRFEPAAVEQHRACPLYRPASRALLPGGVYPDAPAPAPSTPKPRRPKTQAHPN